MTECITKPREHVLNMATTEWKIVCTDDKKDPVPISVGKTVIGRGHLLQVSKFMMVTRCDSAETILLEKSNITPD